MHTALQNAVSENQSAIIKSQVGVATSTERAHLTTDGNMHCDLIKKYSFWNGLEQFVGNIKPICHGTNINQKDSTRFDQILLTLASIYLHFTAHLEPEVAQLMQKRLEKQWKNFNQPISILALVLNSFEGLLRFGQSARLHHLQLNGMVIWVSQVSYHIFIFNNDQLY